MIVVNLFGAPGAGKSTGAAYIYAMLKLKNLNVELITEFAKDKVYEETKEVWNNQQYLFGKQSFRLSRLNEKVDVVVTDAPLFLSAFYNQSEILGEMFNQTVKNVFNSYQNMNYFLRRFKPYNPKGRFQTEEESDKLALNLEEFLTKYQIPCKIKFGDREDYDEIVEEIILKLNAQKV
jgi:adenylate kinase family enzyme